MWYDRLPLCELRYIYLLMNKLPTHEHLSPTLNLESAIGALRDQMNAVILAHYYQEPEIQDIADFIGDSLELSRKAASTDADVIIFCGVKFMAEVAKIVNPDKKVLLPDLNAGCSLEEACPASKFEAFRKQHPDHIALTYINCSAEVKALSDIIVTSSNAEHIIRQIPKDQPILFAPDRYLGGYLIKKTGRDMLLWDGACVVHEQFSERELVKLKTRHPEAHIIAHPECPETLLSHADHIGSTSALLRYVEERPGAAFIVLTESGILHTMRKHSPGSVFFDVPGMNSEGSCASCNNCPYMRLNTMEKLYACMVNGAPEIIVPEAVAGDARRSLERMLAMSPAPVKNTGLVMPAPTRLVAC
ncbi:MAG: quinolinate synthase [Rickettsiales bacterium]|jgi:quinolinate synthase|nr:quinolinate synthase [Rickettsiales bacterium]